MYPLILDCRQPVCYDLLSEDDDEEKSSPSGPRSRTQRRLSEERLDESFLTDNFEEFADWLVSANGKCRESVQEYVRPVNR